MIMGYCSRVGTFRTESAVRKRGGSRNLPYLNAKPRQIPLLGTYAWTVTMGKTKRKIVKKILKFLFVYDTMNGWDNCPADSYVYMYEDGVITMISSGQGEIPYRRYSPRTAMAADSVRFRNRQYSLDERRGRSQRVYRLSVSRLVYIG